MVYLWSQQNVYRLNFFLIFFFFFFFLEREGRKSTSIRKEEPLKKNQAYQGGQTAIISYIRLELLLCIVNKTGQELSAPPFMSGCVET